MLRIRYVKSKREVTIKGHAGFDDLGKDIVCASASMLCYTLLQALQFAKNKFEVLEGNVEHGNARIYCKPHADYESETDLIYSTICAGFIVLSANYPDYVDFKAI